MAGVANAALNIDIRATSVSNGGSLVNGKSVIDAVPGTVVAFDIFAVITGTNTTTGDDKFISAAGSWRSSNGGLLGTLKADILRTQVDSDGSPVPPLGFDGSGSSVGLQQDLDGDGDLDVGSNTDSDAANFWAARYFSAPAGLGPGSLSPTTGGRRIGFGTFTVTGGGGVTAVNFDGRSASTAANYFQDGQTIQEASVDGLVPLLIAGGGGVPTPEPASVALLGLAGLGIVRRRRA